MSIEVCLSVWPRPEHGALDVLGPALRAIETLNAPSDDPLLLSVRITGKDTADIRLDEHEPSGDLLQRIAPHLDAEAMVSVDTTWDADTKRPLTVEWYGPRHGYRGHAATSWGALRFTFSNTKQFERGEHFAWPLNLARIVIRELDPLHSILYTDLEVNPLTAHLLYHRDAADFARDFAEMARLVDRGGAYLAPEATGFPYRVAWTRPEDGGFNRSGYEHLESVLACGRRGGPAMTADEVVAAFADLRATHVERIGTGLLLTTNSAFVYLEEPWLRLCSKS